MGHIVILALIIIILYYMTSYSVYIANPIRHKITASSVCTRNSYNISMSSRTQGSDYHSVFNLSSIFSILTVFIALLGYYNNSGTGTHP